MRVNSLALEKGGQVFKMRSQLFRLGGIVNGDEDGVAVLDAKISVHAAEDGGCEMGGVPGCERMVQTSAELMAGGLCEERHGCLGVADVEVESSGAFPTHLLIGVEEFFDVPSLGEIQGEGFDLVSEASRQEGFEVEFLGCFSCALDELAIDVVRGVAEGEISVSGGPSGPAGHKAVGRDLEQGFLEGLGVGHGSQKVEGGVAQGPLEERLDGMFVVGKNEGAIRRGGVQDELGHLEQFGSGLRYFDSGGAECQTNRLKSVGVEAEEELGEFAGFLAGMIAAPWHLALAGTVHPMGIDRQETAAEMPPSAAEASEDNLQMLCLLDGMGVQEVVHGLIRGDERQAVEDFKTFLAQAAGGPRGGDAEGGFVDELQRQSGIEVGLGVAGPLAQERPRSQTKMFGNQKPEADEVAGDFVGQELADAALNAEGVGFFAFVFLEGAIGVQRGAPAKGVKLIEFFFWRPKAAMTRSTDRLLIGRPHCRIF